MNSRRFSASAVALAGTLVIAATTHAAEQYDAFLLPCEVVEVSAAESGVISAIHVREGDEVAAGALLVELDCSVLQAARRTAETKIAADAKRKAAQTTLLLKQHRFDALKELRSDGHDNPEEFQRAQADLEIAQLEIESLDESVSVARMELAEIDARIARRRIAARSTAVVSERVHEVGEFVSAADPHLLTLENLDVLKATFFLPRWLAWSKTTDDRLLLRIEGRSEALEANIAFISQTAVPETGNVKVVVEVHNPNRRIRAGIRCWTTVPSQDSRKSREVQKSQEERKTGEFAQ